MSGTQLELDPTDDQRRELVALRDHDRRTYLRERAAALLKVADGASASQIARTGLLKPRQQRTVATWVHRYEEDGSAGLSAKPRGYRGCSPCTSRLHP